ncbi:conserved hypothetical protein [Talaromyces stipitatus ATCC 10500]|uniref:Galactosyl transferase GMA12/MNN10 family protein n=1 Tax=Talaromyces stipitatus (strain ATCC 10500 / CBS 375.48 / QM 6759 / NRRL 1006) TaxID=441959 RepID=B8MUB7_TALSN|nr:uncharacterized protein TSTA_108110 [Talaromyces stipitatus ATCC 10500]EED11621.1 conserved hypothetical protein [Talaromyces stipitatus ATCC 10500]
MTVHTDRRLHSKFGTFLRLGVVLAGIYWLFKLYLHYQRRVRQPQPNVGKVTMVYGNNSIYERAVNTHKVHSRRFDYPHFILRRPILDGVWNKYAILLSVLLRELEKPAERRLQWLFWTDADTVLMNPNLPLETFLPPPDVLNVHLLLTKDWNGMNNGVFPIRVHPWSVELLSAALAYPVMNPNVELF